MQLGAHARVVGTVRTGGTVQYSPGSVVEGAVESPATLTPTRPFEWDVQFELGSTDINVPPHGTRDLGPGSYRRLKVGAHATLQLHAGTYFVDELEIKPHAHVHADTSQGAVFVYVRSKLDWGVSVEAPIDPTTFFVAYAGESTATVNDFRGTLVAPHATLRVNGAFVGSVFASMLEFRPHATLAFQPFAAWEFIFPPTPILDCVVHFDATHSTAQWGYENPLDVEVTIPVGPRNLLTPADERQVTTFLPGRHDNVFRAFFGTPSSTWQLGGGVPAAANLLSPRCGAGDLVPPTPTPDGRSRGESASAPRASVMPQGGSSSVGVRAGTLEPLSDPSPPEAGTFRFIIDDQELTGSDAACGALQLRVNVTINGESDIRELPEGCSGIGACGDPLVYEVFERTLSAGQTQVPIRIEIEEIDSDFCGGGDDPVLEADLIADATTGTILSGTMVTHDPAGTVFLDEGIQELISGGFGIRFIAEGGAPPRICAAWRAQYVDSGAQGGVSEDYLAATTPENVPASFAYATLSIQKGGHTYNVTTVLDADGCIRPEYSPSRERLRAADDLVVSLSLLSEACWNPDGNCPSADAEVGAAGARIAVKLPPGPIARYNAGQTDTRNLNLSTRVLCTAMTNSDASVPDCEMQRGLPGWVGGAPPVRIDFVNSSNNEVTRTMAMVSHALKLEDAGADLGIRQALIERRGNNIHPGLITIAPNVVYCFDSKSGDSECPSDEDLYSCVARAACDTVNSDYFITLVPDRIGPDGKTILGDTYWKFIMAHELGHAVQEHAIGTIVPSYFITPPNQYIKPPMCACDQVTSSNAVHCLQSIEAPNAAHMEGWAQFFASRVWNDHTQTDCTFKYYKEFANDTCMPGVPIEECIAMENGFVSSPPPVAVSCLDPVRWRNSRCFDDTVTSSDAVTQWGTEYDYMGFLYSVNTQGENRISMGSLFDVFRAICVDGLCYHPGIGPNRKTGTIMWDECVGNVCVPGVAGLSGGAHEALSEGEATHFDNLGNLYGVDRDVRR